MLPVMASRMTRPWSMLRNCQCETPDARPEATLARFTVVDTALGGRPMLRSTVEDVGPNPMPSAPSTMAAMKPARPTSRSSSIAGTP
jgi:hypothetical protein